MRMQWLDGESLAANELTRVGVVWEQLPLSAADYQAELDRLKRARGYVEQDIVELDPTTPDLDAIRAKFSEEHLHTDDEIRFVLAGGGIFDVRSHADRWMRLTVEPGDLLLVPAHLNHRFLLTEHRYFRCVRLFKDSAGWVPHYRDRIAVG